MQNFDLKRNSVNLANFNDINLINNPNVMRGSLNKGHRINEMKRIFDGNKKILKSLRDVKPQVGNIETWKNHESKSNTFKKLIQSSNLEKNQKTKTLNLNTLTDSIKEVNEQVFSENIKKYSVELKRLPTS